jgi:hypothetical protein
MAIIDLFHLPKNEQEAHVLQVTQEEAHWPFDLSEEPSLRAALLQLGPEENVMLMTVHHIACDGWSMNLLLRELIQLYEAFSAGLASPLPELDIQYADYAAWQHQWQETAGFQAQLSYWRQQLSGNLTPLELPMGHPRLMPRTFRYAKQRFELSQEVIGALKSISRQEGATFFMTLLAALKALLYCYTKQVDIRVGTLVANRYRIETEALIGCFVNTLVLRTDLSGDPDFKELLQRVRQVTLDAYEHQDIPFEKLIEYLDTAQDMNDTSLFQVLFILQNVPTQPAALPYLTVSPLTQGNEMRAFDLELSTFDLIFSLHEQSGALTINLRYNIDKFDEAAAKRILRDYNNLLVDIVSNPSHTLSTRLL